MSVLDFADVEALLATGLEPVALQGIIDRDEDWLATDLTAGIGELTGSRTQRVWRPPANCTRPILLARPTDAVEVVDNGVTRTDVVLLGNIRVEPSNGLWVGPAIDLTYEPRDLLQVKRILIELVRLSVSDSPYRQEATEGHSYSRPSDVETMRQRLAARLHPASRAGASIQIHDRGDSLTVSR